MSKLIKRSIKKALLTIEKIHFYIETQGICKIIFEDLIELIDCLERYLSNKDAIAVLKEYKNALQQLDVEQMNILFYKLKYNLIEYELKERTQVVFFPYNASMWDSLESVWKAAIKDNTCEVQVVPIPYYERTVDGALGRMHYEGHLLPDYVSIIDWREYYLEEERPDIAYIHNPYDEFNRVTSVYPEFYSKNIKCYVDRLVYIPYYLYVNNVVNKEMIWVPGVLNSDYVICQSEECCKKSIEIYDKERKRYDRLADGKDKFLPLGSPIVDKINQKEIDEIPRKWKDLIYKEGLKKKVLFYNTHLSCVMGNSTESFFKKINYVFEFLKNRDDIILLWRPHPLMHSTIHSMNPLIATKYDELVEKYKKEGWGIYDETAKLNRSIAISDVYYGDWSSVATMFQEAGKPVMIEQLHILQERDKEEFFVSDLLIEKEGIWFNMGTCNSLLYYDRKQKRLQNKVQFEKEQGVSLYQKIVRYKEKLFLIPFYAKCIVVYDVKTGNVSYVELRNATKYPCKFFDAVQINEKELYLFPTLYPYVIRLDMETQQIEYLSIETLLEKTQRDEKSVLFFSSFVEWKSRIYMLLAESCILVEYETAKNRFNVHTLSTLDDVLISMCKVDNDIILLSRRTGMLKRVSLVDWKIQSFDIDYSRVSQSAIDCILNNRKEGTLYTVYRNNQIYVIPDLGNYVITIYLSEACAMEIPIDKVNEKNLNGFNSKIAVYENNIYCHMQCHSGVVCINENDEIDILETRLSDDFYKNTYSLSKEIGNVVVEDEYCYTFKSLCELKYNKQEDMEAVNNGLLIHREIMNK